MAIRHSRILETYSSRQARALAERLRVSLARLSLLLTLLLTLWNAHFRCNMLSNIHSALLQHLQLGDLISGAAFPERQREIANGNRSAQIDHRKMRSIYLFTQSNSSASALTRKPARQLSGQDSGLEIPTQLFPIFGLFGALEACVSSLPLQPTR